MKFVYHGSKEHGIKRLEPRKSTHGVYVYATPEKALALVFSGRCSDDLTYDIGHFDTDKNVVSDKTLHGNFLKDFLKNKKTVQNFDNNLSKTLKCSLIERNNKRKTS